MTKPRVVLLRGHGVTPWELRPWELLADRFDVTCLVTGSNRFEPGSLGLRTERVRAMRDLLPRGRLGDVAVLAPGDRYLGLERHLKGADIVHSLELGIPWSGQPARLKERLGFRLVLTVWETIPLLRTYRWFRGRGYRDDALPRVDRFLATTERARSCLLLEGVPPERIEVCPPGIDVERFAAVGSRSEVVVSAGRLVWEKGHQDVLRAVAAIRRGLVRGVAPRLLVVGSGPEEERLRRYAAELGVADLVEFRSVPYDEMPAVLARASCLVLASLATPVWEEQFGMVLAEALAAGVPIVASESGAIPEVVGGAARLFPPGDWLALAGALAAPPPPPDDRERVERFSITAAAARLAAAYDRVLAP
jgi:glycosyltransferase involved in cell wall biosynthesis